MAVHGKDFVILACVVLTQYRSAMDGQTDLWMDASMMAKMREALHAVMCKNWLKQPYLYVLVLLS